MKVICEYCGQYVSETEQTCPYCGAVNKEYKRTANGVPTTIEELKAFCQAHNLPLEQMRFFIGEDYKQPKAFGIYKDEISGEFVVYKNKADGTRSIRYQGQDEAYAVNEIYLKLKSEIQNQKAHQNTERSYTESTNRQYTGRRTRSTGKNRIISMFFRMIFICCLTPVLMRVIVSIIFGIALFGPDTGYYQYNDNYYYYQDDWYIYDEDASAWMETDIEDEMEDELDSYYSSYSYDSSYDASDFSQTEYWDSSSGYDSADDDSWDDDSWDDDWDSDYDWDSGSDWDSGYSDWDSDW